MHFCTIISTLLYLLQFLSLHKSLVCRPSVYILYDECSEDVTGEYFVLQNISGVAEGHWV